MSYANFIILPSSKILRKKPAEVKIEEGSQRHAAIIALGNLMHSLGKKKVRGYYDASIVTKLMKEVLAGNCFTIGLFCVK